MLLRPCVSCSRAPSLVAFLLPIRRRRWCFRNAAAGALTTSKRGPSSVVPSCLDEIPDDWRTFFVLLASTGLRISEAIGLRWEDLQLDDERPRLWVRRGIVQGQVSPPKSRHGNRTIALSLDLANELRMLRPRT